MSDQSEQQNPFRSRRFILSMVVVAIIVLCAVIVLISNIAGEKPGADSTPAPSQSTSAPTTPAAASDPNPSSCGLKGYQTKLTLTTAPKTTWSLVGTVAAPTDPKGAGPGITDSTGFRSCYAHTSVGALYAATNFIALGTDATMRTKLISLVAPGAGRDAVQKALEAGNTNPSGFRAQVSGFKVNSYDGQNATVDLAINYTDGSLVSLPLKLLWSQGDWKVVLTDEGNMPLPPASLQSLGGYIPWAGA